MKIKTSELQGAALDWAVAKCEGHALIYCTNAPNGYSGLVEPRWAIFTSEYETYRTIPSYSTDWAQGGPIIERERIELTLENPFLWAAKIDLDEGDVMVEVAYGDTPLSAAMRCYVASKLGDEVEMPEELK